MASYDRSVASYRQTVLTAFQEVEDNLAVLRILKQEKEVQAAATRAAGDFQRLTNNQYMAGTVSFLNVATAQAAALSAERSSLDILNRQLAASVGLFKALGGSDWQDNASKPAAKLATVP
jgi:outer membrane protein TolC